MWSEIACPCSHDPGAKAVRRTTRGGRWVERCDGRGCVDAVAEFGGRWWPTGRPRRRWLSREAIVTYLIFAPRALLVTMSGRERRL